MGYQHSLIINVPVLTVSNIFNVARVLVIHNITTKVEVFMEKGVRGLATRRNKIARDFTHPFFQISTFLSTWSN